MANQEVTITMKHRERTPYDREHVRIIVECDGKVSANNFDIGMTDEFLPELGAAMVLEALGDLK
jgi:hypothetical protein